MRSKFFLAASTTFFTACTTQTVQEKAPSSELQALTGVIEVPAHSKRDKVFKRAAYYVLFDSAKRVPKWVAYKLDKNTFSNKAVPRRKTFLKDPEIENCPTPNDYAKSGYDRGHLAPAEDMRWSKEAMDDSFRMSNMTPQKPMLNQQKWKQLETLVRNQSATADENYVVTGPVLTEPCIEHVAKDICVSKNHFKVVLEKRGTSYSAGGYVMPQNPNLKIEAYATSVSEVQKLTGIDFFAELPDEVENLVEGNLKLVD